MSQRVCPKCHGQTEAQVCALCNLPTMADDGPDPLVGTLFAGRYEIMEPIGAGGMGTVFKARQVSMDRLVALKVLKRHVQSNLGGAQRFYREMQASSRVDHPNTVRVFDYGHADSGDFYLAMELLSGRTLGRALDLEGAFAPGRIVRIGIQIAKALGASHAAGIVHRDLKPANIFLTDFYGEKDYVKVLDFGVARFTDDSAGEELTLTGQLLGTPTYMAPEQAGKGQFDARGDLYSLGCVLFRMVAGQAPFTDTTPYGILFKHINQAPPSPSDLAPYQVPPGLEAVILKLLAKSPEDRFQSAEAVIDALEACYAEAKTARPRLVPKKPPIPPDQATVAIPAMPKVVVTSGETGSFQRVPVARGRARWPVALAALAVLGVAAWAIAASVGTGEAGSVVVAGGGGVASAPSDAGAAAAQSDSGAADLDAGSPAADAPAAVDTDEPALELDEIALVDDAAGSASGAAADVAPSQITVTIDSDPVGASVIFHGQNVGTTPVDVQTEPGAEESVRFELRGYQPHEERFVAAAGEKVRPTLRRVRTGGGPKEPRDPKEGKDPKGPKGPVEVEKW